MPIINISADQLEQLRDMVDDHLKMEEDDDMYKQLKDLKRNLRPLPTLDQVKETVIAYSLDLKAFGPFTSQKAADKWVAKIEKEGILQIDGTLDLVHPREAKQLKKLFK